MTVKQRIEELNSQFQKSYYDADGLFFEISVPRMIEEMTELITGFIHKHIALKDNFNDSLKILADQQSSLDRLAEVPAPSPAIKDNYLNHLKQNISQALWRFHDGIYRYDARMLQSML